MNIFTNFSDRLVFINASLTSFYSRQFQRFNIHPKLIQLAKSTSKHRLNYFLQNILALSPKSLRLQREQRRFTGWRHESSANSPPLPNLGLIIEAVETRWPG